jgi:hypothetical protein
MRVKVREQLKKQEEVCTKLKMNIDENNITITLLQARLEDVLNTVREKEEEIRVKEKRYSDEIDQLRREANEEQLKMQADVKLERGDIGYQREQMIK